MEILLQKLHTLWWNEDARICGENPACDRVLDNIEMKLREMDVDEMFSQLEELSKLQLEEILPVLDNLREDDYDMKKYIDLAME